MKQIIVPFVALILLASLCWRFPLFRVVPLEHATKEKAAAAFNPVDFAARFWEEQLPKSLDKAVNADLLLAAIRTNAVDAKRKFARSVGVSESYTYFVAGQGRVLAVGDEEISLSLTARMTNAEVVLPVGLLFGNAVRDGTGLLNVNDYPNSQDFNAISEALNRLVESRIQSKLRAQAKVGATIHFVGCAEVNDEATDLRPLKVVPISAIVE